MNKYTVTERQDQTVNNMYVMLQKLECLIAEQHKFVFVQVRFSFVLLSALWIRSCNRLF
jgi:hypothetical protein